MRRTIVDAIGQGHRPLGYERIVSLVPSLTETLFAYGAGARVVGVTRYCTEPSDGVANIPRVGGTKDPDLVAITALEPDLVVASAEENRKPDVERLIAQGMAVFVTLPTSVKAASEMLDDLALLIGFSAEAEPMLSAIDEARSSLQNELAGRAPVPYFCPIWRRPYMAFGPGTYAYDLLERCGGVSICGSGNARYFDVDLSAVAAKGPEVVLLPDEPYPFSERHVAEFRAFPSMPAVARGAVHCVDGKALTWYGPRTAAALRSFAGLLGKGNGAVRD